MEREIQIQIMGKIFSQAETVFVWLGEAEEEFSGTTFFLRDAHPVLRAKHDLEAMKKKYDLKNVYLDLEMLISSR